MLVKTFCGLLLVSCVYATNTEEFIDLLKNITTQDQLHFVQYHVAKGFFVANNISTENYENGYPNDYSKDMFEAFLQLSNTQPGIYATNLRVESFHKLGSQICAPHGPCFDPDDAGTHP